jgi:hypothetical protein
MQDRELTSLQEALQDHLNNQKDISSPVWPGMTTAGWLANGQQQEMKTQPLPTVMNLSWTATPETLQPENVLERLRRTMAWGS